MKTGWTGKNSVGNTSLNKLGGLYVYISKGAMSRTAIAGECYAIILTLIIKFSVENIVFHNVVFYFLYSF